jgi:hypothetical protein
MPTVLLYTRPTINGRRKYVPADPKLKNNQGSFFLRYKVDGKDVWERGGIERRNPALIGLPPEGWHKNLGDN